MMTAGMSQIGICNVLKPLSSNGLSNAGIAGSKTPPATTLMANAAQAYPGNEKYDITCKNRLATDLSGTTESSGLNMLSICCVARRFR